VGPELFLSGRVSLRGGDCRSILAELPENYFDSCATDPPYHLQSIVKRFAKTGRTDKTRTTSGPHQRTANGFMNKQWDGGDIAFDPELWAEVLRVLKPGAFLVAFSSCRTYHRMACAIEDAGFVTHPFVAWIFGQGFPKAHKVAAEGWDGWRYGAQALKPAIEPIYMGQKPFSEINGTANVVRWGTGALNIDGCRVDVVDEVARHPGTPMNGGAYCSGQRPLRVIDPEKKVNGTVYAGAGFDGGSKAVGSTDLGRWPANVVTDGSEEVLARFPDTISGTFSGHRNEPKTNGVFGKFALQDERGHIGNSGSAARFFYTAKPDGRGRDGEASADRRYTNEGATNFAATPGTRREAVEPSRLFYTAKADADDRIGSKHPTVKPVDLIQWLVRLVTPPDGLVLDCFAGTGTTGEAAFREGMRAELIEKESEYLADIRRRMQLVLSGPEERRRESIKASGKTADPGPLFYGSRS
jgi:site-specific DNA-methyltransferase (adenine-specific)